MTVAGLLRASEAGSDSRTVRERIELLVREPWVLDGVIGGGLSVLAQVALPPSTSVAVRLTVLVATVAVALRALTPVGMAGVAAVAIAVMGLAAAPPSVFGLYLAVMWMSFSVAALLAWLAAAGCGLLLATGIVLHDLGSPRFGSASGLASDLALPVLLWGLGRIVHVQRTRADSADVAVRRLEEEREVATREAVAAERARLARELHDVVTHSLSVVVIQAQGAERVLDESPADAARALRVIETAGRTALTEMRHLLGLLRSADDAVDVLATAPQPGLEDLPELVERVRSAGLHVRFALDDGLPSVAPGAALALYRIAQEALTNCLKHAPGTTAEIGLALRDRDVELCVRDSGPAETAAVPTPRGPGRGLIGMRERVATYGGALEASPDAHGGFTVTARLPVDGT